MLDLRAQDLCGSYPPIISPLRADGTIDLDQYRSLVEFQVSSGSHGIVVNGTTAEPSLLSTTERNQFADCGIDAAAGRVPVMVATGSQSLAESIELTTHAHAVGAAAVLVVTPYYVRPMQRGIVDYFAEVASHTDRPVLMYHIPGRAAIDVTIGTLEAIAERVPNFVGMKHAAPDLGLVSQALKTFGPDFRIFVGLEELSFPMLALGAAGMVSAVANVAPAAIAALYEAVAAGDLAEGRRLHYELLELNRSIFFETNPIPLKYMLTRIGQLDVNRHRLPMTPATAETAAACDAVLARAGLLGQA